MKLTKAQKKEKAKEFAEILKSNPDLYLTQYQGLTFQNLAELRKELRPMRAGYRVVKNSMLANALKGAGIEGADAKLLEGPNAVLFARGDDPVSPARVLAKFAKTNDKLKIKAGYIDRKWLGAADCIRLASLGTKPELIGQLAGALYCTVAQAAWVLAAPMQKLALALKAVQEKKSAGAAA
ncbi:MAG: 50S ribosomal protein L10 [Elusimicrobiota bacterium]